MVKAASLREQRKLSDVSGRPEDGGNASRLRVEPYTGSSEEWDSFVRSRTDSTHNHRFGWKRLIEREFGHECIYLAARADRGDLLGVLPMVRVRSRLFGHYLVSMPYLNDGGPLGAVDTTAALTSCAMELARRSGVDLLELRSREPQAIELTPSHRKITVLLDLPEAGHADRLWGTLGSKMRSQIRRPQKDGATVRFGLDEVSAFYGVFAHHMRDLGTPAHARTFFEAMAGEFPDSIEFGTAYLAGRPVAAGCGFRWGSEFELVWAAALRAHSRIAPNMLLYWRFIERCIDQGLTTFNFGRCTPDSGTHRFKQQWGGRDHPLWWYQFGNGRPATPSPRDVRYRWGSRVWQQLPVSLATRLGPAIVRYLP